MWSRMVPLAVGCALLAAGCTSGEPAESETWRPRTPAPNYLKGDYRSQPDGLCASVSTSTLGKLGITEQIPDETETTDGGFTECEWERSYDDAHESATRTLTVRYRAYAPPETRREYTATREARYQFREPEGWQERQISSVPGLGDDAKASRQLDLTGAESAVWLAVRHRNLVLDVRAETGGDITTGQVRKPSVGALETTVGAAVDELLAELRVPASPQERTAYQDGEVAAARDVCGAVGAGHRPSVSPDDTSTPGSRLSAGCRWVTEGLGPELYVGVEAVPPSRFDGRSATRVATDLFEGMRGERSAAQRLGDDSKLDTYSYESGESRTVWVHVRKDNLLLTVEYERWQHPSAKRLERDAVAVAEDVLEGYE